MSFIGWLDHSEEEQLQVRKLLKLFEEKGTFDDLGIGTVRDAISNRLFPGTSDAGLYDEIQQRVTSAVAPATATKYMAALRGLLRHLGRNQIADMDSIILIASASLVGVERTGGAPSIVSSMSLFGDINQRHSDWTASSWIEIAEQLELTDEEGEFDLQVLEVGYRSTRHILRYANQLLPKGERDVHALREGEAPTISQVGRNQVALTAVGCAIELADRHPEGLVAIIAMDTDQCSTRLRSDRWARGRLRHSWVRDGKTLLTLAPQDARGLEFDGVVVVEPADFPENVGRLGPLYTSLTRATQELAVVYSKALPRALRPR